MNVIKVPDIVVSRLPIYLRALDRLAEEGQEVISSEALGNRLDISSAQIRKDLSHFGEFGKQGTGYEVSYLRRQLRRILNIEQKWPVALVGWGALGSALTHYGDFESEGFKIEVIFDNDPHKVGQPVGDMKVLSVAELPDIVRNRDIKIAIVSVPPSEAQETVDLLVASGIKAILNYAPISVSVPPEIHIQYIDPSVHLQRMTFYL